MTEELPTISLHRKSQSFAWELRLDDELILSTEDLNSAATKVIELLMEQPLSPELERLAFLSMSDLNSLPLRQLRSLHLVEQP
jgi:hypothetical protein